VKSGLDGYRLAMTAEVEVERVLAAVTATMNNQEMERLEPGRLQQIVTEALGGGSGITVDDGGGLHDEDGVRFGAIRRTPSGEWIAERQNPNAARSRAAIPSAPPPSVLRRLLSKLKLVGS
jgi:hypothetical protein